MQPNVPDWDPPRGVSWLPVTTSAYYAVQRPDAGIDADTRVLCALHGWGQNSRSFLRRFDALRSQNILVVAPQAPNQFYLDRETKKVGFSWLTTYDRNRAVDDIATMISTILTQITSACALEATPVMLGFSQGVSIAYRYHALAGNPVRGIIACGGDLPMDVRDPLAARAPFPVRLVHGNDDRIVPIQKAHDAEAVFSSREYPLTIDYFHGDHEIPKDSVRRMGDWIMELA